MRPFIVIAVLLGQACSTDADSLCQDIGYCTTRSDDQVKACQDQAKQLGVEATSSGCAAQSGAYFSCAANRYECRGSTPTFDGCEAARIAFDGCLAQGRAHNACGALATRLLACPSPAQPDRSGPPAPCGASEECGSRCYLDNVVDVCKPQPAEIAQAQVCGRDCP